MEVVCYSETFVNVYKTRRRHSLHASTLIDRPGVFRIGYTIQGSHQRRDRKSCSPVFLQPTVTSFASLTARGRTSQKLMVTQLVKKFRAFYVTRTFIAVFITAPPTGTYPEPDESSPHLISLTYVLIVFPNRRLTIPNRFSSSKNAATCPAHLALVARRARVGQPGSDVATSSRYSQPKLIRRNRCLQICHQCDGSAERASVARSASHPAARCAHPARRETRCWTG